MLRLPVSSTGRNTEEDWIFQFHYKFYIMNEKNSEESMDHVCKYTVYYP